MKDFLFQYGDRGALIKYALGLEYDLMLAEAYLMNLQRDLTALTAHKIRQVNNQPTPPHLVVDNKPLADLEK